MGTTHPDAKLEQASFAHMRWEPAAYFLPRGQTIQGADAQALARCIQLALAEVDDREVPMKDGTFGRLNTLHSVQLAMGGDAVPRKNSEVAIELLSGGPKGEAVELSSFLAQGRAVRILPEDYCEPVSPT